VTTPHGDRLQAARRVLDGLPAAKDPARYLAAAMEAREYVAVRQAVGGPSGPRKPAPEPEAMRLAAEMTEEERVALPAECHRPVWNGLGTPHLWACAVCWGEGTMTSWPCEPARAGGLTLARHLGLDYHW